MAATASASNRRMSPSPTFAATTAAQQHQAQQQQQVQQQPQSQQVQQTQQQQQQQQPLSKRDKKRHQVEQRIKDIETSFFKERDFHLRNHLSSVNRDIHYVNRANPYANKPLEDFVDDAFSDVVSQLSAAGSTDGEARQPPLGKFSQQFVDAVNDSMEERDARLTETTNKFHTKLAAHKIDLFFAVETAEAEHRALMTTLRERMIGQVETKRRQLKKEKEMLDAADYSTLVNNGLTLIQQPSSPGGMHTQRRTRNTRRLDPHLAANSPLDSLADAAITGDASAAGTSGTVMASGGGGRKKRKTLGDQQADIGSPNPNGSRSRQQLLHYGNNIHHQQENILASALWDTHGNGKQGSSSSSSTAAEVKVDRYFTARELTTLNKRAREEIATNWVNKMRPRHHHSHHVNAHSSRTNGYDGGNGDGTTVNGNGGGGGAGGDDSDEMDTDTPFQSLLVAPAMDRTGSSHATRSTRALYQSTDNGLLQVNPAELGQLTTQPLSEEDIRKNYGSAVLAALTQRSNMKETNKDVEIPYTTGMSQSEQTEDWQYISSL